MPGKFNFFSNITFIKFIAIIYVTIIYAIGGLIITISTDRYLNKPYYDKSEGAEEKISTKQHIIETVIILSILGIFTYIGRNILQLIPFPLEGIYGFKHLKVKELTSATIFSISFMYFQVYYQNKIKYIFSKLDI